MQHQQSSPHSHNINTQFRTTYIYSQLGYFFSPSQWIDYQIGLKQNLSLQMILQQLQHTTFSINSVFGLFSYLFEREHNISQMNQRKQSIQISNQQSYQKQHNQDQPQSCSRRLIMNLQKTKTLLQNDGLRLVYSLMTSTIHRLQYTEQTTIDDQMIFKILVNVFYCLVYYIEKQCEKMQKTDKKNNNYAQEGSNITTNINIRGSSYLNVFYKQVDIDAFLIKLLTLSLEAHYVPIKKITMLYTKVLANLFSYQSTNAIQKIHIHPITIFDDSAIQSLPLENTLQQNYLQKLKEKSPPLTEIPRNKAIEPIQQFYRKHNMGDCPLAQSIVVGLLRSLLTICNSQNHKKFTTIKGAGVDSFREWQLSYRYAIQNWSIIQQSCTPQTIQRIRSYQQFDRTITQKSQPLKSNSLFHQFYMHKIYTTSIITNFFTIILLGLKLNVFIQYLYFLQLISDANGILVFLKFLTDKFQYLDSVDDHQCQFVYPEVQNNINSPSSSKQLQFKDKVMLTVYSILKMLHSSCNNYPEKVKNYLFQYNSYLIIKKIPVLFFPDFKNKKVDVNGVIQQKKKQDMQGSLPNLPSREQLEQLMNKKPYTEGQNQTAEEAPVIIRYLTQTCYDLLKIQIPYFSKKMKDTNNMKMLIDIYCRFPKNVQPINRSALQKMQLKCRNKKHMSNFSQQSKIINSVEQMKNMHNQYNNIYYWSNDFVNQLESMKILGKSLGDNQNKNNKNEGISKIKQQPREQINQGFDYEQWLQQNIWKYYD